MKTAEQNEKGQKQRFALLSNSLNRKGNRAIVIVIATVIDTIESLYCCIPCLREVLR